MKCNKTEVIFIIFIFLFFIPSRIFAQFYITTIAGDGTADYGGDNGLAVIAQLNQPRDLAVDDSGNVFIADRLNACIRKIDQNGIITTIGGVAGHFGYNGDSIMATDALLNNVEGIAVDKKGNIYIADHAASRIRKISSSGIITTIAGTGLAGYNGDGMPATIAQVNLPDDVAVDKNGNVYICDAENNRIRSIDTFGTISTIAGNGSLGSGGDGGPALIAGLFRPHSICLDTTGNIYISDSSSRVRKIDLSGTISLFAGSGSETFSGDDGPATAAGFVAQGLACDKQGCIYIADHTNRRIRMVNNVGVITTVAGQESITGPIGDGGPATAAILFPSGVAVDSFGNIYISDDIYMRVRKTYLHTDDVHAISGEMIADIFPNPSQGAFTINFQTPQNNPKVIMFDNLGREVKIASTLSDKNISIFTDVPDGSYFMSIIINKKIITRKIIINN